MTSAALQRSAAAVSALGLLLSAFPGYAQNVAPATKVATMTTSAPPQVAAEAS